MNLVLDIGNTAIKAGVFENSKLIQTYSFGEDEHWLKSFLHQNTFEKSLLSSVSNRIEDISELRHIPRLTAETSLPFTVDYLTPNTLGSDRLAAVAGALGLFPNQHCLVIDSGTCITFELLDADKVYHGGAISPGIDMRFRALNNFTSKLPLVQPKSDVDLIGKSTEQCILSGVINGTIAEINNTIENYKKRYIDLQVILCGGNIELFESKIKESIFVQPDLVLYGLNTILEYNVG